MKAYVHKTSNNEIDSGIIREFNTLEECIRTLMKETKCPDYVVSDISLYYGDKDVSGCSWLIEIYDYYRE